MFRKPVVIGVALLLGFTLTLPIYAQGNQAGTLRGNVRLSDGSAVPGVTVTAASSAIQGQRTTYTNENGEFIHRFLKPGDYEVTFELEGMATAQSTVSVQLGQTTPVNVTMQPATQEETITVVGELPSVIASSQVSTTYDFEEVNNLPIGRTPAAIASLAPGLSSGENTPNNGQVSISGGFAYDNVFLIDGVDANDNLFGSSNNVFIEDAIADIQVLTSGISAEYGRFSGGVINVITKSGGNEFSGSIRATLENDDWRSSTPLEKENETELVDDVSESYQATLGGYAIRDKLWFFLAGRDEESSEQDVLAVTAIPTVDLIEEERKEYKLTGNIIDKHTITAQFTDREQTAVNPSFGFSATPDTIRTRSDPNELVVGRWNGILTDTLFGELQYSEKTFGFRNSHGAGADRTPGTQSFIENSPFFDFFGNFGAHYNAPYFDGSDPEDRDNEQVAGSLSFFLDTGSAGSHDLKVGIEDYSSFRRGGNSQTPTDWVMSAAAVIDANGVVLTADNKAIPDWQPGTSAAWQWLADREAEVEINTQSFYVNDSWQFNDNWSFNVGFRYEEVKGDTNSGIVTTDTDRFVPRLGASYDLRGDGKYRFDATFAQYAGKYSESQFAENTSVGNPAGLLYIYTGPAGQGLDFAPAYDFNNQLGSNWVIVDADDGTQNIFVADGLSSPISEEYTLGFGMQLDRGGYLKAVYTSRDYSDFVEDFITPETGQTEVVVQGTVSGTFNNTFIDNSDAPSREYQALQLIGRYRLTDNWTLDGSWTHQLKNEGNFEGEAENQPGNSSVIGDYPEIYPAARFFPTGDLNDFAANKIRLWSNYSLDFDRAGRLNIGTLLNFNSGISRSSTDDIGVTPTQRAILDAAGYANGPAPEDVFFGPRGDVTFDDSFSVDLSLNYRLPIVRDFDVWLKADVFNVFDDDAQIDGDTDVDGITLNDDPNAPLDEFGLPLTFSTPDDYLTAEDNDDFTRPREYQLTVGFAF